MKNKRILGILSALAGASLFGLMPLFTKTAYANGVTPYTVVSLRFGSCALVLILAHLVLPGLSLHVGKKHMKEILVPVIPYALTSVLLFASYQYIDSGLATTIHFVYPIIVMLYETIFSHKRQSVMKWILAAVCVGGVTLLYTPGGSINFTGVLLALASGVAFALNVYFVGRSTLHELSPFTVCCLQSAISFVIITVFGLAIGEIHFDAPFKVLAMTGLELGVATTLFAYSLFVLGVKLCGDVDTSLANTMEPLVSILVGVLVFEETLSARSVAGIVCILAASVALVLVKEEKTA